MWAHDPSFDYRNGEPDDPSILTVMRAIKVRSLLSLSTFSVEPLSDHITRVIGQQSHRRTSSHQLCSTREICARPSPSSGRSIAFEQPQERQRCFQCRWVHLEKQVSSLKFPLEMTRTLTKVGFDFRGGLASTSIMSTYNGARRLNPDVSAQIRCVLCFVVRLLRNC